jgi:hypothetical protein
VWQDVVDGSGGEHDQAEGRVGGVKSGMGGLTMGRAISAGASPAKIRQR